jgi:hypothetical protein
MKEPVITGSSMCGYFLFLNFTTTVVIYIYMRIGFYSFENHDYES